MGIPEIKTFIFALFTSATSDMVADCETLIQQNPWTGITITSSAEVRDRENLPGFCQIIGVINPKIGFEARFPLRDWNDKYYQAGCGGYCGQVLPNRETHSNAINHALRRSYATITTDGGHQSSSIGDASWATNENVEKVYAAEVIPRTYAAARDLIKLLYGKEPAYSYFSGCSNGGRLAAKAAQDYPDLFDGIISGCPVLNLSKSGGVFAPWVLRANLDGGSNSILDRDFAKKLPMLEKNALAQCDALDGTLDGAIQYPEKCAVVLDPIPDCSPRHDQVSCMTIEEKRVVEKLYQGPVNSAGQKLFYGVPPGSERYWEPWYLGDKENPAIGTLLAEGFLPNLGFPEDPENYNVLDFDLDRDLAKLEPQARLLDALDPDLSAFKESGGKLIMWHGQSDPLVLPGQSREYYEAVTTEIGQKETDSFFRLFLVPGMGHCWELPSQMPDQMNILQILEKWVEEDEAPSQINVTVSGAHEKDDMEKITGVLRPYPALATYTAVKK